MTTNTAPARKPFYTRWWFIALAVVLVLGAIGQAGQIATSSGGTQVTVVPGRMYYLPLPVLGASLSTSPFNEHLVSFLEPGGVSRWAHS